MVNDMFVKYKIGERKKVSEHLTQLTLRKLVGDQNVCVREIPNYLFKEECLTCGAKGNNCLQ